MTTPSAKRMVVISHTLYKSLLKRSGKAPGQKEVSGNDDVYTNISRANKGQAQIARLKAKAVQRAGTATSSRVPLARESGGDDDDDDDDENGPQISDGAANNSGESDLGLPDLGDGNLSEEGEIEDDLDGGGSPELEQGLSQDSGGERGSGDASSNTPMSHFKERDMIKVSPRIDWLKRPPTPADYEKNSPGGNDSVNETFWIPPPGRGLSRTPAIPKGSSIHRTPLPNRGKLLSPSMKERLRNTSTTEDLLSPPKKKSIIKKKRGR